MIWHFLESIPVIPFPYRGMFYRVGQLVVSSAVCTPQVLRTVQTVLSPVLVALLDVLYGLLQKALIRVCIIPVHVQYKYFGRSLADRVLKYW